MNGNNTIPFVLLIAVVLLLPERVISQNCDLGDKANDMISGRKCAPVNVDWQGIYRGVNDGGTGDVKLLYNWDDGTPMDTIQATLTNAITREWRATASHIYPKKVGVCNYNPNVIIVVNGEECTSSRQYQTVTVWDTDEFNGGQMIVYPRVFPICVGEDGRVIFWDASQWNCTPPSEKDMPNKAKRWIQWIYGTGAGNIITAEIGDTVRAWPYTGKINVTPEPIYAPIAPFNESLPIYIPVGYNVGDYFEITLRNWNYCNPYDDPEVIGGPADPINGDNPPVITTAMALIVPYPDPTINPVTPMCANAPTKTLTAKTPGGTWSGTGIENAVTGRFNPALAGPGKHKIIYTIANDYSCEASDSIEVEVYDIPSVLPLAKKSTYLCPGIETELDGNPSGGKPPYATHLWTGPTSPLDDVNIVKPTFMTIDIGTYILTYYVTDSRGCKSSGTITMNVSPVDISLEDSILNVCAGVSIMLEPKPEGGSQVFIEHLWTGARTDLLSNTKIENPVFQSTDVGTFDYQYYVKSDQGCDDTIPIKVIVHELPISFAGDDKSICALSTTMEATPSIGNGYWKQISGTGTAVFADTTNAITNVTVSQYGSYTFRWSEDNQTCVDADDVVIQFLETPNPSVMPDTSVCALTTILRATPHVGTGQWIKATGSGTAIFGTTNQSTTDVSVNLPGIYRFVWLETNGSCQGSDTVEVIFNAVADAIVAPIASPTCTPTIMTFVNNSTNADTYLWDFGDGNTSSDKNPTHTFENLTINLRTYTIQLKVTNSSQCNDSTQLDLVVYPSPRARFTALPNKGCSPLNSVFTNLSEGATSYQWDFGDGSAKITSPSPTHQYINNEQYVMSHEVILIAENTYNCSDTISSYVTVYPLPDVDFTATPDNGCEPLLVDLIALPGAASYEWDYGDGIIISGSMTSSQLYLTNGNATTTYNISLKASTTLGCTASATKPVTVYPSPVANMSPDKTEGCAPFSVNFTNLSTGATKAWWVTDTGGRIELSPASTYTHTFDNTTQDAQWQYVKLVVENSNGCRDSIEKSIHVYPRVSASISPGTSGCTPHSVAFQNFTTGGQTYQWDFGDGGSTTGFIAYHLFENTTAAAITYQVVMTATSVYNCSEIATTQVTVYPEPTAAFSANPDITEACAPFSITFTNLSTGATRAWWVTETGGRSELSPTAKFTHLFDNQSQGTEVEWVRLVIENSDGCRDSVERSFSVHPRVTASISPGSDGCSPHQEILQNLSSGAKTYSWDFGDGMTDNTFIGNHTFVNTGITAVNYIVTMTATSLFGCTQSATTQVTVYPVPKAAFSANPDITEACAPFKITFTNQSTGAAKAWWVSETGESTELSPTATFTHLFDNQSQGTEVQWVRLVIENSDGCRDSVERSFNVHPRVTASISPGSAGCSPHQEILQNLSSGAKTYSWDFGDGTTDDTFIGNHTFINTWTIAVTYNVTMTATSSFGCAHSATTQVTVYPVPTAAFSANPDITEACAPFSITFTNLSTGAARAWWVTETGGSTELSPTAIFTHLFDNQSQGTEVQWVRLVIENSDGCRDSVERSFSVHPRVTASISPGSVGCSPHQEILQNLSSGAKTYSWDFGDGTTDDAFIGNHTFINSGTIAVTYNVTMTATSSFGCAQSATTQVTVYPLPAAAFSANPDITEACAPFSINFTNLSTGAAKAWWVTETGGRTELSPTATFSHIFDNQSQGTEVQWVRLVIENSDGCRDSVERSFSVHPRVTASISPGLVGCSPHQEILQNLSSGAKTYSWDFGDGTTDDTFIGNHTFINTGTIAVTYNVTMTATSSFGCAQLATTQVTVYPVPIAAFSNNPDIKEACAPFSITFTNQSTGAAKAWWVIETGGRTELSTTATFTHLFDNQSQGTEVQWVRLVIENRDGCRDSVEKNYNINPKVYAQIGVPQPGCTPLDRTLQNNSSGAISFLWDFGDGITSTKRSPNHVFTNTGDTNRSYTITLTATSKYQCTGIDTTTITVYPKPQAAFSATPLEQQLPQSTVTLLNQTPGAEWMYSWRMGDGVSATTRDAIHTYSSSGYFTITLNVTSIYQCSDSTTQVIHIIPLKPFIDYGPSTEGCVPVVVEFYNHTSDGETFLWEFGDNTSSQLPEPLYVYNKPGKYNVKLTATGQGGVSTAEGVTITVYDTPIALFDLDPRVVTLPDDPVAFRDLSIGEIKAWLWDFGDNNLSTEQNPIHLYQQAGTYDVTLNVTTHNDCEDTYSLNAAVTAKPGGHIDFPNAFTPSTTGPGDGTYSLKDPNNPVFFPFTQEGIVEYKLQIYNRWGELIFESNDVTIGWDGYFKGKLSRQDVYIWKAVVKFSNGKVETFSGDVTLLR